MLRGILAILAGLIVILVTSFGIEAAVTPLLLRMFPAALPNEAAMSHNLPVWLFTFSYTFLCVVAGGYVTARLAPHHNVRHALILGIPRDARLPRQSSALGLDCIDDPRDPRRMVRWTPLRPASQIILHKHPSLDPQNAFRLLDKLASRLPVLQKTVLYRCMIFF
jgi:hypothetical protein